MRKTQISNIADDTFLASLRTLTLYGGAGAIGTAAHFAVLFAALNTVGPVAASTIGAVIGCIINYILAQRFVFASTMSCARSFPRFVTVAVFGIALNAAIIATFIGIVPIAINQVIASGTVLFAGFALNKRWTFHER